MKLFHLLPLLFITLWIELSKSKSIDNQDEASILFNMFMKRFGKKYNPNSIQYEERLNIFKDSLARIHQLNSLTPKDSLYGITSFSDLTKSEFKERNLYKPEQGLSPPLPASSLLTQKDPIMKKMAKKSRNSFLSPSGIEVTRPTYLNHVIDSLPEDLPLKVDWRDQGCVSEVTNQGKCGACWAHSTIQTVESIVSIRTNQPVTRLSVQQVVDCASSPSGRNHGCNGGDTCSALEWMVNNRIQIMTESDYPTRDESGTCYELQQPGVQVSNYSCIDYTDKEETILIKLAREGPLTAAVDATSWQDYLGGIIQYHCESNRNHAVQIVGYDLTGVVPFYIVRNTWGRDFGINGYLHIAIGKNMCGIAEEVSSVSIRFSKV